MLVITIFEYNFKHIQEVIMRSRGLAILMIFAILFHDLAYAEMINSASGLLSPGSMVHTSSAFIPATVKGLVFDTKNPMQFDFLIDSGDSGLQGEALARETKKLAGYFLASLTVPEKEQWVNLSPYESDRISPEAFAQTAMGHDLLVQDYFLKQVSSSLTYPERDLGRAFWDRVYKKSMERYGTTDVLKDFFSKVWIVPQKAVVYSKPGAVYLVESSLKVMAQEDYKAMVAARSSESENTTSVNDGQDTDISLDALKELILPEIQKDVNTGRNFAVLRQVYSAVVLATWYKRHAAKGVLGQAYFDRNKVQGIDLYAPSDKDRVYENYVEAFKKGVYQYIKDEEDPQTRQISPRKYFSGGMALVPGQIDEARDALQVENKGSGSFHLAKIRLQDNAMVVMPTQEYVPGYRQFIESNLKLGETGRAEIVRVLLGAELSLIEDQELRARTQKALMNVDPDFWRKPAMPVLEDNFFRGFTFGGNILKIKRYMNEAVEALWRSNITDPRLKDVVYAALILGNESIYQKIPGLPDKLRMVIVNAVNSALRFDHQIAISAPLLVPPHSGQLVWRGRSHEIKDPAILETLQGLSPAMEVFQTDRHYLTFMSRVYELLSLEDQKLFLSEQGLPLLSRDLEAIKDRLPAGEYARLQELLTSWEGARRLAGEFRVLSSQAFLKLSIKGYSYDPDAGHYVVHLDPRGVLSPYGFKLGTIFSTELAQVQLERLLVEKINRLGLVNGKKLVFSNEVRDFRYELLTAMGNGDMGVLTDPHAHLSTTVSRRFVWKYVIGTAEGFKFLSESARQAFIPEASSTTSRAEFDWDYFSVAQKYISMSRLARNARSLRSEIVRALRLPYNVEDQVIAASLGAPDIAARIEQYFVLKQTFYHHLVSGMIDGFDAGRFEDISRDKHLNYDGPMHKKLTNGRDISDEDYAKIIHDYTLQVIKSKLNAGEKYLELRVGVAPNAGRMALIIDGIIRAERKMRGLDPDMRVTVSLAFSRWNDEAEIRQKSQVIVDTLKQHPEFLAYVKGWDAVSPEEMFSPRRFRDVVDLFVKEGVLLNTTFHTGESYDQTGSFGHDIVTSMRYSDDLLTMIEPLMNRGKQASFAHLYSVLVSLLNGRAKAYVRHDRERVNRSRLKRTLEWLEGLPQRFPVLNQSLDIGKVRANITAVLEQYSHIPDTQDPLIVLDEPLLTNAERIAVAEVILRQIVDKRIFLELPAFAVDLCVELIVYLDHLPKESSLRRLKEQIVVMTDIGGQYGVFYINGIYAEIAQRLVDHGFSRSKAVAWIQQLAGNGRQRARIMLAEPRWGVTPANRTVKKYRRTSWEKILERDKEYVLGLPFDQDSLQRVKEAINDGEKTLFAQDDALGVDYYLIDRKEPVVAGNPWVKRGTGYFILAKFDPVNHRLGIYFSTRELFLRFQKHFPHERQAQLLRVMAGYFQKTGGMMKAGYSEKVASRLADMQMRNRNSRAMREIYQMMAQSKGFGSWFIKERVQEITAVNKLKDQVQSSVVILGSARYSPPYVADHARLLSQHGFSVVTGGGPGVMEEANRGAMEGGARSIGLALSGLPNEQAANPFINLLFNFKHFPMRIDAMKILKPSAALFYDGGVGTLHELFSMLFEMDRDVLDLGLPTLLVGKEFYRSLSVGIRDLESRGFLRHKAKRMLRLIDENDTDTILGSISKYARMNKHGLKDGHNFEAREIRDDLMQVRAKLKGLGSTVGLIGSPLDEPFRKMPETLLAAEDLGYRLAVQGMNIMINLNEGGIGVAVKRGFRRAREEWISTGKEFLPKLISVGVGGTLMKNINSSEIYLDLKHESVLSIAILTYSNEGCIFFPGGTETLALWFQYLDLVQTGKMRRTKAILVNSDFWDPWVNIIKEFRDRKTVSDSTITLSQVVDKVALAAEAVGAGDNAQAVNDVGGIDLDPEWMDLQVQTSQAPGGPSGLSYEPVELRGLTPRVISIEPVQNIHLLIDKL